MDDRTRPEHETTDATEARPAPYEAPDIVALGNVNIETLQTGIP